ncbi:hypothetical protein DL93DRAFT_1957117 [Clavulina sp. PMI_390]|nr:hypothetical protein DL93DRAFT_1957117 [Clavulina sp. PMI_390]
MKSVSRAERKRATEFLQLLDSIGIFLGDHIDPRDVEDSIPFRVDAVRLQRALFTKPSVSQHRELARMLENLSFVLSKHKKAKLACIAAEQALIIRRECYKLHPDTDCVPLATLLDRYSGRLHSDNRNEEAIGACKEAADLWGTLSTDDGNIYSEFQADSLQNLGLRFDSLQRFEDAKTAEEQGLMLRRTLYEKDPEQHRKPLLKSLENYIASLKNLGLAEETRAAREEQESLRSPSVSHENRRSRSSLGQTSGIHPSYKDYLRTSLLHGVTKANDSVAQSEHLLTLDHHPNPLSGANSGSPISTQIDVYSTWVPSSELLLVLNECSSDTSMDDSSMKLKVEQALGLARLAVSGSFTKGKRETSVKFRDVIDEIDTLFTATPKWRHHTILLRNELTRLQRVLCIGSPLGQQGDLARFLLNEALALQYHGRGQEAPKLLEEALVIQRECFRLRPGVERPRLAFHLEWHSFCLHAEQRYEEAVEMCEEELRLRRLLYEFDPEESIAPLADVLQNLGVRLNSAQRPEDAKVAEAEGLVLRRILYDAHPELHRENLVTCLKNHGITLNALGLKKESKAVRAEYRQIRALSEDGSIITA